MPGRGSKEKAVLSQREAAGSTLEHPTVGNYLVTDESSERATCNNVEESQCNYTERKDSDKGLQSIVGFHFCSRR